MPSAAAYGLRTRYPELASDVIDALGAFWAGPALDRKTRSLVVVAMLAATGKAGPLKSHIAGALNHGASPAEVIERCAWWRSTRASLPLSKHGP